MEGIADGRFLIMTECMTVTSAMRKSSRWVNAGIAAILGAPSDLSAESGSFGQELMNHSMESAEKEHKADADSMSVPSADSSESSTSHQTSPETSLILGFSSVRPEINAKANGKFNSLVVIRPFLEVIKSPLVSGHITSLALTSLEKFFVLGILGPDSEDIEECLDQMIYALTHCRFEASDRQEDDAVLLQLMGLLDKLVSGACGVLLSRKALGEIVETCVSMARQMKRRDSLRYSVVATVMSLVHVVFSNPDKANLAEAARDIFSSLVALLDPSDLQNTNSIRVTVLSVLKHCFETSGRRLGTEDSLEEVMQKLWKYLAQLIRSTNSPKLVREALRLVATIVNTSPEKYKLQFEFILVYVLTSLTPLSDLPRDESTDDMFYAGVPNRAKSVKSAPVEPGSSILAIPTAAMQKTPETREVMVEALAELAVSSPTLFTDLYITYDCDRASPDLCEDLLGFLCRNAYPDSATWSTASVPPLCLESVLSGISAWAEATDAEPLSPELRGRLSAKEGKAIESQVAETFNKSPSKGIANMQKYGLVKSSNSKDIAEFLHTCKRINKAVLGKFFAKSENKEVLEYYVKSFDFHGKRIDEALRTLLCSFRLPGESAQIENLLQKFADHYIESGDKVEKSSDSAFILAYAVLMLNTDHYSPTLKRRMDYEAFRRNVQGVDKEIPDDYVQAIFDGITSQEIIMPEEHDTDETFEHSWRELVLGQQPSDSYLHKIRSNEVVKAVFDTNWRPIVSTLSFVFATATDDLVFRRVISGFHQLAILASRFKSQQALTHIIACLSQISALTSGDLAYPNSNIEIIIEDHVRVIVSDLSTQFGGDLKAQMASITLFRILNLSAKEVDRSAYGLIAKALTNLHIYGLGTPSSVINIMPLTPRHTFKRSQAGKPVGILSALSSYLTSSADTPPEPSDDNVDAALGAAECIRACKIDTTLRKLLSSSPTNLAEGALDVLPPMKDEQANGVAGDNVSEAKKEKNYKPATEFLLRLAGRAAEGHEDLQDKVSKRALEAGLVPTALLVASPNRAAEVMDSLESVNTDVLQVLPSLPPSRSLWRLVGLIDKPSKEITEYIDKNAEAIDEESIMDVLSYLGKYKELNDLAVIEILVKLSIQFRGRDHYADALAALGSLSSNKDPTIRENSLSELQRELSCDEQQLKWSEAAEIILIPKILESLLKPEVWKRDPSGMDLTRQQAASMVGKVFLHLRVSLNTEETEADVKAWVDVLRILDRLLSSRRQPALHESVVEMLKNVILVTKLASKGSPEFWDQSYHALNGFLPEVAQLLNKDPEPLSAQPEIDVGESKQNTETTSGSTEEASPEAKDVKTDSNKDKEGEPLKEEEK